ncbi:hypothetical protein [Trichodesmium erythraeum]
MGEDVDRVDSMLTQLNLVVILPRKSDELTSS